MRLTSTEQFFLWVIKLGLWAIPFLPLYVSSSMLFPFITGKNFTFRIIVEVIFALWAWLAIMRPEFRPRLTPLFKAVTVFVTIVFLADLFSPNPYRAFFSNYERMGGFMMLFHLYLYFVMLVSVFNKRDWLIFFHLTLVASVLVSYVALLQKLGYRVSIQGGFRVDSTIGNPTYLAAYLMFHLWLLLILIYQFWRKWWLTGIYGALLIFELAILYFTATRGAILALVGTSVLLAVALFIYWPRVFPGFSWGRKIAGAVLILSIIFPLFFWSIRDTEFVKQRPALRRLTNYSLREKTINARFMIWNMSWRGFLERPLLGWGQENYYLVFQKYFDPGLYDQEPWFDRSHNIVFDWLIHAGILGLLAYLSIFGAVFWILYQGMRNSVIPMWTGLVLAALFISYFGQNLFVFDNLNTYFLFFAFLAYTEFLRPASFSSSPPAGEKRRGGQRSSLPNSPRQGEGRFSRGRASGQAYAVVAALFVAVIVGGYFLNLKPLLQSKALIRALQVVQSGGTPDQIKEAFERALSYDSFGTTEVREQLGNVARSVIGNEKFSVEERKRFAEFTIGEFRKETAHPAKDVKHLLFLGAILNRSLAFDPAYAAESERVLKDAIRLSPTKQIIYFELAQLYLSTGRFDLVIDTLQKSWDLDRSYYDAAGNLWAAAILAQRDDVAQEVLTDLERTSPIQESLDRVAEVYNRAGQVYQQVGKYDAALEVYRKLVDIAPHNSRYRLSYAALLGYFGATDEAKRQAEEAVKIDPSVEEEVGKFLQILKQTNP